MKTRRRYEFSSAPRDVTTEEDRQVPTAEQQWSDFQKRVVNGQLTEPEKRLIRRSMEHSMKADRLESRTRTLESQLTKVGENLAEAAIRDGELELEAKPEFVRRFEADPVAVVQELQDAAEIEAERQSIAGRLMMDSRDVI